MRQVKVRVSNMWTEKGGDLSNLRGEASKPNHPHKVEYRTDGSSLSFEMTCWRYLAPSRRRAARLC